MFCVLPANRVSKWVCSTSCSWSARARVARIRFFDASLVITNITGLAIRVSSAFRSASGNRVRFGNQTGFTPTKNGNVWPQRIQVFLKVCYLQIGFPIGLTEQTAPRPQGLGLHGSGLSMHRWFSQTKPPRQSGSITHSGPHPVIVSGFGTNPWLHLHQNKVKLMSEVFTCRKFIIFADFDEFQFLSYILRCHQPASFS